MQDPSLSKSNVDQVNHPLIAAPAGLPVFEYLHSERRAPSIEEAAEQRLTWIRKQWEKLPFWSRVEMICAAQSNTASAHQIAMTQIEYVSVDGRTAGL